MAKQNFVGLVVSQGKMAKTVKVRVQTKTYDKSVHKEVVKRKDYLVHDQGELCKEGDIVRIEAIPKISARKYFAVAEIKVNKGQQFALYEKLAIEKVAVQEQEQIAKFFARRDEFNQTITHLDDLRKLDSLAVRFQGLSGGAAHAASEEERQQLLAEIGAIKEKYNIKTWPAVEPVVSLQVSEALKDLSVLEHRVANIKTILDKMLGEEQYAAKVEEVLQQLSKKPVAELSKSVRRNMLRKWVLNEKNEVFVQL